MSSIFRQININAFRFALNFRTISTTTTPLYQSKYFIIGGVAFVITLASSSLLHKKNGNALFSNQVAWNNYVRTVTIKTNQQPNSSFIPKTKINPSISRISNGPLKVPLTINLYQYQSCPFCCKVRAMMDYFGVPYNVVEVNPVLRSQLKFSNYKKVPFLLVEDTNISKDSYLQVNDSSLIISVLGTYLQFNKGFKESLDSKLALYQLMKNPEENKPLIVNKYFVHFNGDYDPKLDKELIKEREWREWVDNVLVHVLSPNIYRTWNESLDSFKHFDKVGEWEKIFNRFERYLVIYVGALAMYFIGKRLSTKYNLKKDVRESLYDCCRYWMKSMRPNKFMGGNMPNFADLAVYGVLNSIDGTAAFKDLLNNVNIGQWYYEMKNLCENHAGAKIIQTL